jgi:hypothetical protein
MVEVIAVRGIVTRKTRNADGLFNPAAFQSAKM